MVEVLRALSEEVARMLHPDIIEAIRFLERRLGDKKAYAKTVEKVFVVIEDLFNSIPECDLNVIIEKYENALNTIDSTRRTLEKASSMTFIPKAVIDEIMPALDIIKGSLDKNVKDIYKQIC
jgi:hypothetical protein